MRRAKRLGIVLAITGLVIVIAILVSLPWFMTRATSPPPPVTTPAPSIPGYLTVDSAGTQISPDFYGVGIQAGTPLSSETPSLLSATPIHFIRFPDGTAGDETDLVNNTVYTPGESNTSAAAVSLSDFISACTAVSCSAIVELPLEIDDPGTAAYEVGYIENTLGFHPAYWELGNEPGGWTCFGVPWADWGSDCHGGTNATEYAQEVSAYIPAVREVDPSAQFIGLGGTDGAAWITPLEREDGPGLAGISLHSYVDDLLPFPSNLTISNFFRGLSSPNSIPGLLDDARKAILDGCPTCSTRIFVTELDSVSMGQPLAKYLGTFYNGVFFAAEIVQGLTDQVTNIDPFTWESAENGLITPSGPAARYVVESSFLSRLGSTEFNASVNTSGVYAVVTEGGGQTQLLLVNTNATYAVNVSLVSSGLTFSGSVDEWSWDATEANPVESVAADNTLTSLTVPPTGILLAVGAGSL